MMHHRVVYLPETETDQLINTIIYTKFGNKLHDCYVVLASYMKKYICSLENKGLKVSCPVAVFSVNFID